MCRSLTKLRPGFQKALQKRELALLLDLRNLLKAKFGECQFIDGETNSERQCVLIKVIWQELTQIWLTSVPLPLPPPILHILIIIADIY